MVLGGEEKGDGVVVDFVVGGEVGERTGSEKQAKPEYNFEWRKYEIPFIVILTDFFYFFLRSKNNKKLFFFIILLFILLFY